MPPAFVLSQDQTLKFIPDLLYHSKGRPKQGPPNARINARTSGDPTAAVRASLPSSPQSQTTSPRPSDHQRRPTTRGRAYRPTKSPRQHPIGIRHRYGVTGSLPTRYPNRRFVRRIIYRLVERRADPRKRSRQEVEISSPPALVQASSRKINPIRPPHTASAP